MSWRTIYGEHSDYVKASASFWGHPRSRSGLAGRARAPAGVAWGRPFDPHGKIEKSYRHRGTRGAGPRGEMPMGRISANFPVLHPCCQ